MSKENKNEKELSEEKFGKVSGGGNLRPGFKIPRNGAGVDLIGYNPNVDIGHRIGYPNPLTRKKDINSLPKTPNIEL